MTASIVKLRKDMLDEEFTTYPINVFEDENMKEKRRRALVAPVQPVWKQQYEIMAALQDFDHIFKFAFTNVAFNRLLKLYANLDIQLQDFNKLLKAQKAHQEVGNYYKRFEHLYSVNVFKMFSNDIEYLLPLALERHEEYLNHYQCPDDEPCDVDLDELRSRYKDAVKEARVEKDKKDKENKK